MKIKAVLMDLDGTVYRGDEIIPGALDAIEFTRQSGLRLLFFTNNSEKNRYQISQKLCKLGVYCSVDDIISSGYISALFVKQHCLDNVFVIGTEGLRSEFEDLNIPLVSYKDAKTTVIGMDSTFDYEKMKCGVNAAINSSVIIACNKERLFPCNNSLLCPGCGAIVSSIEYSCSKKIDVMVGKPSHYMMNYVSEQFNLANDEILVLGDTFDSDIVMAQSFGSPSILIGEDERTTDKIQSIKEFKKYLKNWLLI